VGCGLLAVQCSEVMLSGYHYSGGCCLLFGELRGGVVMGLVCASDVEK
jgi:hypothetical protein